MARLTIEQVQAPNMSAAGNILAQAGASFDRGLSTAQDVLGKYQEGQNAVGDAALLEAMIGVKDEAGINDFLTNNDLAKMNLSPEMREAALGLRDSAIGYAQGRADVSQTQANTRSINAGTDIAQALEGRNAADWQYGNQRRDEIAGLTGAYADAVVEGQQFGNTGVAPTPTFSAAIDRTESGGANDQYDTLFGHRNRQNGVRVSTMNLGQVKEFSSPSGQYGQSVNSEIGRVATPMGKYQIVGTTLRNIQSALDLPDTVQFNPAVQELMGTYLGQQRVQRGGSTESLRAGLRAEWEGFKHASDAELDGIISELQSTPPVTRDQIIAASSGQGVPGANGPVNQNRGSNPAAQALQAAVSQGSTLTPADVDALFGGVNAASDRGQVGIDGLEAERVQNTQAQAILDGVQNPDNLSAAGVVGDVINAPGLSASQQLAAATGAEAAAQGPLAGVLAPAVAADPLVAAQQASDARIRDQEVAALPASRINATAERYGNDAVGGLISDLGLGADGEDPRTYAFGLFGENADENQLRIHINNIAERAGVTPAVAAAAMADEFNRDPWGINRNSKRFNPDDVVAHLNETVSGPGQQAYEGALVNRDVRNARSAAQSLELQGLQATLAKTSDPQRRAQLENQIKQTRDQAVSDMTPQEAEQYLTSYIRQNGMASRLRGLDPQSADYFKAIEDLRTEIERDNQLGDREKSLLISQLPS